MSGEIRGMIGAEEVGDEGYVEVLMRDRWRGSGRLSGMDRVG